MNIPSKILENAVSEISRLPGIGKSTALRLALHLVKSNPSHQLQDLLHMKAMSQLGKIVLMILKMLFYP